MDKTQNNGNVVRSDDFYISDEAEEITSAHENDVENNSAYDELLAGIEQGDNEDTAVDSSIDTHDDVDEHQTGSTYNDTSTMTDEELQEILSSGEVSTEEKSSLEDLTSYVEPGDETITSLDSDIESKIWNKEHDDIVSSSVENIVQNILGEDNDQEEESQPQDYVESIISDENNYNSTISELATMVEGIETGTSLYADSFSEEKHEDIVARIEGLWAELAEVWPVIQKQPHVAAKIEELWKLLKQDGNETYVLPSEFEQLFQETDTSSNDNILDLSNYRSQPDQAYTSSELTNSDTLNESPLDEPHKHLFKNGKLQTPFSPTIVDDKLGDLVSSILGENTDSNETLFQPEKETDWSSSINNESSTTLFENIDLESTGPETATNTLSVDNELGDLVSSILGENTESDEPRFDQTIETSTETDWLAQLTGETNTGKSVTDEPEYKQTDNETSETAINTTSNDDEVSELVANLLGEDADSIETLSQMEDATYSNTSDDDTTDIVNDILKKYAQEGDNQSGQNTGLDTLDSDTTPSNDKFVVDEELQKILESTTDSNAIVSDTPVSDTPVSNASVTSAPTQTTQSKKAETESRSTQRTTPTLRGSVTKSKYSITTQSNKGGLGKVHVNVTSGPDTPSSGWKWALASLVPIAIIAMVWTYLRSDDEVNQLATSMDNMALYASKRESISTSARNNTTREESIEDVVQRMTETDTTSPLETATYSEFSPVFVPEVIPEAIPEVEQPVSQEIVQEEFAVAAVASPIIEPTSGLTQNGEQNLQNLTDHISRLEATITDLQQTAAAQDAAVTQAQETANTLPVEKITQLIDVPVANLQQGVDQRFMELGARITRLESAVKELHQSALLMKQEVMKQEVARQKATSENNENAVLSQGNQQQINTLTQRLSEIESSLQDQAAKISSNEEAQALQQKELQQKILSGNKVVANKASVALSQGNQQQIQSLTHRIKKVESSLQDHATDISHTKIIVGNSTVPATGTGTNTGTGTGTDNSVGAGQALIEKDNSGITITLNKPASGQPGVNSEYRMITHIVVKNDTLWSIAKRYVKNPYLYPELARLSNIKNPNRIYPGNRIRIIQFID